jgi:hypothetical protein
MDNPTGSETVCLGDTSLTGWTSADPTAFFEKLWPSGIVNGPVNTPTPEKGGVSGVYDHVDVESGDIAPDGMYSDNHIPPWNTSRPKPGCVLRA